MDKATRIITDGAGQEISAQIDNVIAKLNNGTVQTVSPSDYTSKEVLSEETGRSIAEKIGNVVSAINDQVECTGFGTCETASATSDKVVVCDNFVLELGSKLSVKFTYANTASTPTLNVNGTGAIAIMSYGATAGTLTYRWNPKAVVEFVYDGTYWIMQEPAVATSTYFGVTKAATLNGSATTSPSFYAPTSAGTSGYVLKSNGSGAPTWTSLSALTTDYNLPAASSTELGGVMLGSDTVQTVAANSVSSTSSRTYAVQANSKGQVVVNVPWTDTNTTYSAGSGLSLSGTTFNHSNSVSAGTVGSSSAATLTYGGTFAVPYITYDAQGHITATGTRTLTMPASSSYSAGSGLSLSGTTFNHSNSVSASNAGPSSNVSLSSGSTFTVPYITYDAQGHITSKANRTMTMPTIGLVGTLSTSSTTGSTIESVSVTTDGNAASIIDGSTYYSGSKTITFTKGIIQSVSTTTVNASVSKESDNTYNVTAKATTASATVVVKVSVSYTVPKLQYKIALGSTYLTMTFGHNSLSFEDSSGNSETITTSSVLTW